MLHAHHVLDAFENAEAIAQRRSEERMKFEAEAARRRAAYK
jgi:hypothetical protein